MNSIFSAFIRRFNAISQRGNLRQIQTVSSKSVQLGELCEPLKSEGPREGPDNNIQNTLHAPVGRAELRAAKLHEYALVIHFMA